MQSQKNCERIFDPDITADDIRACFERHGYNVARYSDAQLRAALLQQTRYGGVADTREFYGNAFILMMKSQGS